jgi:MtN3 and saliva related transmembrane protein
MTADWLGYAAATLTTLAFVPQAAQILRTRDTHSISLPMYLVFTIGVAFWLGYGWMLGSWPMIAANTVTFLLAAAILGLKLRYG